MFVCDDVGKLFGQEHLFDMLLAWSEDLSKVPQSMLFYGPYGCGKTSIARIFAKKLTKCKTDICEINASEARGIDDVRGWAESARFSPIGGAKIYIIDELHQMTQAAQSALLKVIETPPPRIYFFLCTTEPGKLLPALQSRCTRVELKLLSLEAAKELCAFAFQGKLSSECVEVIYRSTGGHARDIIKYGETALYNNNIQDPKLLAATIGYNFNQGFSTLQKILDGQNASDIWEEVCKLTQIEDPTTIIQLCDLFMENAVLRRHPKVIGRVSELLAVKQARSLYQISAKDQMFHLVSIL